MADPLPDRSRADLLSRLRRIEGQARGVQRMLEEGRDCREILDQLNAIRAATLRASLVLLRTYTQECLREPVRGDPAERLDELMLALWKMPG